MPAVPPPDLPFAETTIEVAVREYVDVLKRLEKVELEVGATRKELGTVQANIGRLADRMTPQELSLGRIERQSAEIILLLKGLQRG